MYERRLAKIEREVVASSASPYCRCALSIDAVLALLCGEVALEAPCAWCGLPVAAPLTVAELKVLERALDAITGAPGGQAESDA